jgi:diguanylate cyclase (GGDEF)-like protein
MLGRFESSIKSCLPILLGSLAMQAMFACVPAPAATVQALPEIINEPMSFIDMIYAHHEQLAKGITAILAIIAIVLTIILITKSTERKKLKKLFYYDTLTGYKNYNSFKEDVPKILEKHPETNFAIFFIDIVEFKFINSAFGYEEGDKVLKGIADIFARTINRQIETFARITSDHFVVLLSYERFKSIDVRIKMLFNDLENFSTKAGKNYNLIFNGGVYLIEDHNMPINSAVDKASFAEKTIKQKHKTAYAYYNKSILIKINEEKTIEATMREALRNGEFVPYLQPKIDCMSGVVVGAEALVRWIKPNGEVVFPNLFIPYFEKNGFITKIDMYMFGQTCRILRKWIDEGKDVFPISCNFSYLDLVENNFPRYLKIMSQRHKVPADLLELELTESVAATHSELVNHRGKELSNHGFRLSIDDFGAGYSSLSLLQILPMNVIKLDKNFVQKGLEGKFAHDLVSNLVKAFKDNSIQVIFEGIETEEQLDFVKSLGCRIVQGFYYSKPLPLKEFEDKYFK